MICFAGIIYDVIIEPPSIGSVPDEKGNSKPVSLSSVEAEIGVETRI